MKPRNIILGSYLLTIWIAYAIILISSTMNYEADCILGYGSFKAAAAIPLCFACITLSVAIVSIRKEAE